MTKLQKTFDVQGITMDQDGKLNSEKNDFCDTLGEYGIEQGLFAGSIFEVQ